MGANVDYIIAKFPIKVAPTISRQTKHGTINKTVQNLYGNMTTLPTTLRGGIHVHIRIIIRLALYITFSLTPYTTPTDPEETPAFLYGIIPVEREQIQL